MDWQIQSIVLAAEIAAGMILFRFFIPFFRRVKTGKFDLYIGDRFKKDGSEPKFAGAVMALTAALGLTVGLIGRQVKGKLENAGSLEMPAVLACCAAVLLITAVGIAQDYHDQTKRGTGLKTRWVILIEFVVCLGFSFLARFSGVVGTKLLLPFHLGNIELGFTFYPLTAALMTVIINLTELHDCPGGVTDYGCDGLCAVTVMMFSLASAGACALYPWAELPQMLSVVTVGCCAAYLYWGMSPSKMYLGRSGGKFLGSMAAVITVTTDLPLIFLSGGIVFIADGVCTLVGHLVFRHKKQLLFKGLTLHGHLKNRGWGEYRIIGISAVATLLGAIGVFMYMIYANGIRLD